MYFCLCIHRLKLLALVDSDWLNEMCSAGPVSRRKRDLEQVYFDQKLFEEIMTENKQTITEVSRETDLAHAAY